MKTHKIIGSLFFLFAIMGGTFSSAQAEQNNEALDQIVAVVNDDVVTKSELNKAMTIAKMQISQEHLPTPAETVLTKQVLDQLINKKLQLQIAKQVGITIPDDLLDQTIGRVAKQNNISIEALYQQLSHEGMTKTSYRDEIREQLTLQKLQQQEVVSHITISPEEVTAFMRSRVWQSNESKEYHLEDILIPLTDTPSSDEVIAAKKHALTIVDKLKQGQSFQKLALAESGDKHALQGGDLGWRQLPEIPSAFAEYVTHLQAKEIAGPIQTPNGFHVIRLIAARNLANAQGAPSKKQVEDLLLQRKFEEAVQNWVSKIRSQAFVVMQPTKTTANA